MASAYSDGATVSVTLEVPASSPAAPAPPGSPLSPGHTGPLPFTGIEIEWLVVAAITLIIAGVLILSILRTRMEPSHA